MATSFITNTASLKTTIADVRKLNAKKIFLGGENILDIINRATPTIAIKHANDTRTTVTENDLWGQYIETKDDGTIIVHDDWVINSNKWGAWNNQINKVEYNKAYTSSGFYANIQTEKIKNGTDMFNSCDKLASFKADLSSLTNGVGMFYSCNNLTSFYTNLSSLTVGYGMFAGCFQFKTFASNLPSLTNGAGMFSDCNNLKSFTSDLPSLTTGNGMFARCPLTSFSSNLPSLTTGENMFNNCSNITTFSSDLPSLTDGYVMFAGCTNLTTFNSDLSSLMYGDGMFNGCKLDAESVMYIADSIKDIAAEKQLYIDGTIPYVTLSNGVYSALRGFMKNGDYIYTFNEYDYYDTKLVKPTISLIIASCVGKLTLGINVTPNSSTIKQQLEDFAKTATFDTWSDLKTHFSNKGWTVTFKYGGSNDTIPDTYGLRGGERIIPCSIFAKLVEADKDSAQYCTEDASSFYNIEWGHDVTDTTDYTQFDSLEDAMASWNVFPKENIITSEE